MELGFHPFCYQSPSAFITSSALLTSPGHCHRWPSCPAEPLPASEPALKQKHTLVCCLSMARLCRSLHHHQVRGSQRDRGWVSWDRLWVIPQERIRNILQLGFLGVCISRSDDRISGLDEFLVLVSCFTLYLWSLAPVPQESLLMMHTSCRNKYLGWSGETLAWNGTMNMQWVLVG